jgi:cell pole-organizing protein PopZ
MPVPPVEDWGEDSGMMLDDAVLDEEALRDMVSEIVRQELQGALGERITRNVRKLVRREIHRALASQDMD